MAKRSKIMVGISIADYSARLMRSFGALFQAAVLLIGAQVRFLPDLFESRIVCRRPLPRFDAGAYEGATMSQLGNCSGETDLEKYGGSRLALHYEPIVALRLDPQNPRLHSRKQVRQIAKSIKSFGFNVPVVVDAQQRVIAGHGRILAAKELGWTEVPVIAIERDLG
jgi:ParB-like nuclease domain